MKRIIFLVLINILVIGILFLPGIKFCQSFIQIDLLKDKLTYMADPIDSKYLCSSVAIIISLNIQMLVYFMNNRYGKIIFIGNFEAIYNTGNEIQYKGIRIKAINTDCELLSFAHVENENEILEIITINNNLGIEPISLTKNSEIKFPVSIILKNGDVNNKEIKFIYKYRDTINNTTYNRALKLYSK